MKRGLVAFVFDGFDELCGNRHFAMTAAEALDNLLALVTDSDARILITTRTQFWESEIGTDPPGTESLQLLPFNAHQAKDYISKYFGTDRKKFEVARQMYGDVAAAAQDPRTPGGARAQFFTLPICVSMICAAVDAGVAEERLATTKSPKQAIQELLIGICDREAKRQNLAMSGRDQLETFKEIALLEVGSEGFTPEDLAAGGVPDLDVKKFNSHPLLRAARKGLPWTFNFEFLPPYLRALAIVEEFQRTGPMRGSIVAAMAAEANGKGALREHVAQIILGELGEHPIDVRALSERLPGGSSARCFLLHLAASLADEDANVTTNRDRRDAVLAPFASDVDPLRFSRFRFTGTFERLDFSAVHFYQCDFTDVIFKQSLDWDGAVFRGCVFDGVIEFHPPSASGALASARFEGCEFRGDTRVALEQVTALDRQSREELVKDLMDTGLSKFWHNGKYSGSIRKDYWNRGTLGRSKFSRSVIEAFEQAGLVKDHVISGVKEGGWLFDRDSIQDLRNFMDHRQITGRLTKAYMYLLEVVR